MHRFPKSAVMKSFALAAAFGAVAACDKAADPAPSSSKLPFSGVVDTKGIQMLDDHHFVATANGQPVWAQRAIAILQANNWMPGGASAIAPTLAPAAARKNARIGFAGGKLWFGTWEGAWSADGRAPAGGASRIADRASWAPVP